MFRPVCKLVYLILNTNPAYIAVMPAPVISEFEVEA
jgi:hypothetical protein